jgi:hypothetical protein
MALTVISAPGATIPLGGSSRHAEFLFDMEEVNLASIKDSLEIVNSRLESVRTVVRPQSTVFGWI